MRRSSTSATCSKSLARLIAIIVVYLSYQYLAENVFRCQPHGEWLWIIRSILPITPSTDDYARDTIFPRPHLWGILAIAGMSHTLVLADRIGAVLELIA